LKEIKFKSGQEIKRQKGENKIKEKTKRGNKIKMKKQRKLCF
jgi:hypothetical protein